MSRKQRREALQAGNRQSAPVRQPLVDATAQLMPFAMSMQVNQSLSTGPFPPPEVLAKYNDVVPGMAAQILKMAEDEASHRREMEKSAQAMQGKDIGSYRRSELFGQIFGFAIGTIAICGAVYAAVHGAEFAGSFIGTAGVTGLAAAFILGRHYLARQKEMEFRHQLEIAKIHDEKQRVTKDAVNKATPPTVPATALVVSDSQPKHITKD